MPLCPALPTRITPPWPHSEHISVIDLNQRFDLTIFLFDSHRREPIRQASGEYKTLTTIAHHHPMPVRRLARGPHQLTTPLLPRQENYAEPGMDRSSWLCSSDSRNFPVGRLLKALHERGEALRFCLTCICISISASVLVDAVLAESVTNVSFMLIQLSALGLEYLEFT